MMADSPRFAGRIADLVVIAAQLTDVTVEEIYGRGRPRRIARVRQAISVVASNAGNSTTKVGRVLGIDHTSVCYARQVVPEIARRDPEYADLLSDLDTAWRGSRVWL